MGGRKEREREESEKKARERERERGRKKESYNFGCVFIFLRQTNFKKMRERENVFLPSHLPLEKKKCKTWPKKRSGRFFSSLLYDTAAGGAAGAGAPSSPAAAEGARGAAAAAADSALDGLALPLATAAASADLHAPSHLSSSLLLRGPLTSPTKPKVGSPLTGESTFEPWRFFFFEED